MNKNIIIAVSIFIFFMFLVYAGVFRDNTNPVTIAKYYFECLKNREGFLTYRISTPDFFNPDPAGGLYEKYNMNNISKIEAKLVELKNNFAYVETKIIHKDSNCSYLTVELEKGENGWLILSIS